MKILLAIVLFFAAFCFEAYGQTVRFGVNLALASGIMRDTITVGVSGDGPGGAINDNTYGLDPAGAIFGPFGRYGENLAPPGDPDGNRVRVVDIPGRTAIGAGMFRYDYRGFTSSTQIDTFAARIDGLRVETTALTVSWSSNPNLSQFGTAWTLYSRAGSVLTQVANMLTTTSHTFEPTGSNLQFVVIKVGAFTTDVKLVDDIVPSSYALEQNYPNPFNPSTEIRFSMPEASNVELKVYNLVGQEVASLVNEFKSAGTYSAKFDAGALASGVYLYRLQTSKFVDVKKLVLTK